MKLENILIGNQDTHRLYLIDFGLASQYLDQKTGRHIRKLNTSRFSGNFMFASLNTLRGNNKSRRDDFESVIYILVFLISQSSLPWFEIWKKFDRNNLSFEDIILERMKKCYTAKLVQKVPQDLKMIVKKTLCLGFKDEPPYAELLRCLENCFQRALLASAPKSFTNISIRD